MNVLEAPAPRPVASPFPVLETERLILRRIEPADRDAIFALFSDPAVVEFNNRSLMTTLTEAADYITRRRASLADIQWGITLKSTTMLIGACEFYGQIKPYFSTMTGFELSRAYWGQGIMTEAMRAMLDYGFTRKSFNRIQAQTTRHNQRCMATLHRLGFQYEGILRQYGFWKGQFHDCHGFSLLKSDWRG